MSNLSISKLEIRADNLEDDVSDLKSELKDLDDRVEDHGFTLKSLEGIQGSVSEIDYRCDDLETNVEDLKYIIQKLLNLVENRDNPHWSTIHYQDIKGIKTALESMV